MKQPKSWKDFVEGAVSAFKPLTDGHSWNLTGTTGKRSSYVRRVDQPSGCPAIVTYHYQCKNCGTKGSKTSGSPMELEDSNLYKYSCDEIIVRKILL